MPQPDFSPAAERNKQPILEVLRQLLPERGSALEIASGTGQHVAWFAAGLPHWVWQPSDAHAGGFDSIAAWVARLGVANVRPPLLLDVMADRWLADDARLDAIFCANMLHISPWATCAALMRGSARHLAPGCLLITYGPYLEGGVPTSPGNLAFDASLRAKPGLGPAPPRRCGTGSHPRRAAAVGAPRHAGQQPAAGVGAAGLSFQAGGRTGSRSGLSMTRRPCGPADNACYLPDMARTWSLPPESEPHFS